jgi:hypothetical protein
MRRWVIAGLATAEATDDEEPQCPRCTAAGSPTAPAPHIHHLPTGADAATARVFVFDTYETA